jgi:DNA-binding MarR family transcriptional regulator
MATTDPGLRSTAVAPFAGSILLDVFAAYQASGLLIDRALAGLGLSADDLAVWSVIRRDGPLTPTALATRLQMPLTTVLFRTRRGVERGELRRRPNPDDARSFLLETTAAGNRLLDRATRRYHRIVDPPEYRMGPRRDRLRALLTELRREIDRELASR